MILKRLVAPLVLSTTLSCGDIKIDRGVQKSYENCGEAAKAFSSFFYYCYCYDNESKTERPKCSSAAKGKD